MNYLKLITEAISFAQEKHKNQTRWNKSIPYFTHLESVANLAAGYKASFEAYIDITDTAILIIVGYLHNCVEDQGVAIEQLTEMFGSTVSEAVALLSKNINECSYLEYILRIKSNKYARIVKIADLTHNMSDLKKGSMRDKYMLAKYILEQE